MRSERMTNEKGVGPLGQKTVTDLQPQLCDSVVLCLVKSVGVTRTWWKGTQSYIGLLEGFVSNASLMFLMLLLSFVDKLTCFSTGELVKIQIPWTHSGSSSESTEVQTQLSWSCLFCRRLGCCCLWVVCSLLTAWLLHFCDWLLQAGSKYQARLWDVCSDFSPMYRIGIRADNWPH